MTNKIKCLSTNNIKPKLSRIAYLDNLKVLTIILVVIVHAAVTYSGLGSWFYMEHRSLDNVSFYLFVFLQTFSQAFFMSLLFAISGYFIPDSLAKKGIQKFIADRIFRLGLPTLIFAILIFPICETMISVFVKKETLGLNLNCYLQGLISFKFVGWTGPLWFALTLLIFTLIYVACKKWCDVLVSKYAFNLTVKNVLVFIFLITIVAFVIRLIFPIGTAVINLQFCFFSSYIFMFFMGIFAKQKNMLEKIDYKKAKMWLLAAFVFGIPFWILIMSSGRGAALAYAFWESFFCVTIILGLLGIFKERFNTQNSFQKFLSDNSFGVFVFHAPVLIAVSIFLKNFDLLPIFKFAIAVFLALPASFAIAYLIRKVPLFQKIFS